MLARIEITKTSRCNTGNQVIWNSRFENQCANVNLWLPHAIDSRIHLVLVVFT